MSTETTRNTETPETAVWYFIGATFAFALGPSLFNSGGPSEWQALLFNILGVLAFVCGCIIFFRERRQRSEAKRAAAQETLREREPSGT